MATPPSLDVAPPPGPGRAARRRAASLEEALDHAVAIMTADGVGALTVSEVARRMGMRGPSLYKYFPSRHALYDALFARGLREQSLALQQAVASTEPGRGRLRAGAVAVVRWCVENPALAQLLHWRPVPGFEPSPETFATSVSGTDALHDELSHAVRLGDLPAGLDVAVAARLLTVLISGVISQQMANQPGAGFSDGVFTRLTDETLDMFFDHYAPRRT